MNYLVRRACVLCGIAAFLSPLVLVPGAGAFDSAAHRRITETALADMGFDADSIAQVNQGKGMLRCQ
mgnify:CR=1 FL=1